MTPEQFDNLVPGSLIRHKGVSTETGMLVVTAHYGTRITAVMAVDITNPAEWDVVRVAQRPVTYAPSESSAKGPTPRIPQKRES